jgi:hypothetical protein
MAKPKFYEANLSMTINGAIYGIISSNPQKLMDFWNIFWEWNRDFTANLTVRQDPVMCHTIYRPEDIHKEMESWLL